MQLTVALGIIVVCMMLFREKSAKFSQLSVVDTRVFVKRQVLAVRPFPFMCKMIFCCAESRVLTQAKELQLSFLLFLCQTSFTLLSMLGVDYWRILSIVDSHGSTCTHHKAMVLFLNLSLRIQSYFSICS